MGKSGRRSHRQVTSRTRAARSLAGDDDGDDLLPSSVYDLPAFQSNDPEYESPEDDEEAPQMDSELSLPSKFDLYQRSVQSPKGDISYLFKFFLMYVGGRAPLHLQEDFCGTAFLSSEWLRGDQQRTAIGLDLDLEALHWCHENNLTRTGSDISSRMFLFHGNVLQPLEARPIRQIEDVVKVIDLRDDESSLGNRKSDMENGVGRQICNTSSSLKDVNLPYRDIVCAFNYSCCCLRKRTELVLYFKNALNSLSRKGGIFVMDVYGGISSEHKLHLQRKFSNFKYVWEQTEFDVISRQTRISLHFRIGKKHIIRHAFSYDWRLWSLPEIKECMEEAGFKSVHFWIREMPNTEEIENKMEYTAGRNAKYEERVSFHQQDSWNAYIELMKQLRTRWNTQPDTT